MLNNATLYISSSTLKSSPGFRYYKLYKGEKLNWPGTGRFYLVYLLRGTARLDTSLGEKVIYMNEGILIGEPEKLTFRAMTGCRIILISLDEFPNVPEKLFIYSLRAPFGKEVQPSSVPIISALRYFLDQLIIYIKDGVLKGELTEIKYRELFILLQYYYSSAELAVLFRPLISQSKEFRLRIYEYASMAKTACELQMAMGMKRTTFEKKFRKEFGISAHQWLLRQKAFEVRTALADIHLSLGDIRKQYGFNSATHFVRFCQNQFGSPPSVLRKKLLGIPM